MMVDGTAGASIRPTEKSEFFETSKDAFHNGAFFVLQPNKRGLKSGMDAVLLAASLPGDLKGTVADLGSGAGVAGLALLNRNRELNLVAVERNPDMAELARQSVQLEENAHLQGRVTVVEADVCISGKERIAVGLGPETIDHVIMNPPYNAAGSRAPQDTMRAEAFMMKDGMLESWFRTAASLLRTSGTLALICRTEILGEVIECARGRFGNLEVIPLHSKPGEKAKRMIVRGKKASRAPLTILPGFVLHEEDGKSTPAAKAIFEGRKGLGY